MRIAGIQKLSLLDYPGKIACTVFLSGCNLCCPYCHNAELISAGYAGENISRADFEAFLDSRIGKLEGVCISGGEPTLHPELPEFIESIRKKGFLVKLDTNGTFPGRLKEVIDSGMVDYIAMDIKNAPGKYPLTVGMAEFDVSPILESIGLIRASKVRMNFALPW